VNELAVLRAADVDHQPAESLLLYSRQVRQHIEDLEDIDQALDLHVVLVAVEKRLRQLGKDKRDAEAGQTECLLRGGELLGPAEHGGDRRSEDFNSEKSEMKQALYDLRWQMRRFAAHRELVKAWCVGTEKSSLKPSAILRYLKQMEDEERVAKTADDEQPPQPDIRIGDFRDVLTDVEPGTVDLVLTDPPYDAASVELYRDAAKWAAVALKPGGSLVCYAGQSMLPDVLNALGEHLRYWWTFAVPHRHGGQQLPGKWIICEWKPVLWYVKDHRAGRSYVGDRLQGSRPLKIQHAWAQGLDEVLYLIHQLTDPGELIVDPFAGSGSFGYAALALGRRFIGADLGQGAS
jgi:16S rRNA G966 N2-methylase RsmD